MKTNNIFKFDKKNYIYTPFTKQIFTNNYFCQNRSHT